MNAVGSKDNKNTAVTPTHVLGSFSIESILNENNSKVVDEDGLKLPMDRRAALSKVDQREEEISPILNEQSELPRKNDIGRWLVIFREIVFRFTSCRFSLTLPPVMRLRSNPLSL